MSRRDPTSVPGDDDPIAHLRRPDVEQLALGHLLTFPADFPLYHDAGFCTDYFSTPATRAVWAACSSLAEDGVTPALITVCRWLKDHDLAVEASPAFVASLPDGVPKQSAENLTANARVLADIAHARRMFYALEKARVNLVAHPGALAGALRPVLDLAVTTAAPGARLDPAGLTDGAVLAAEGRAIAAGGIAYLVRDLIPNYGMVGMLVAYAKVGKTSFAHALGAAVAMGRPFLDRDTRRVRVLVLAAEDPPEYTAHVARHLPVEPGAMTFYRRPVLLDAAGIAAINGQVQRGGYGLVLISSWQAVVRGLIRDENDNAGAVAIMEHVKQAGARTSGVPWLIDAHAGKAEDQSDDADPNKAMRGASAAQGAADYALSLRYANGTFGTHRRLSGKGRFVNLAPLTMDFDPSTGNYSVIGTSKDLLAESTWQLIQEMGALTTVPRTAGDIARAAGLADPRGHVTQTHKRQVAAALARRPGVLRAEEMRHGKVATTYRLATQGD